MHRRGTTAGSIPRVNSGMHMHGHICAPPVKRQTGWQRTGPAAAQNAGQRGRQSPLKKSKFPNVSRERCQAVRNTGGVINPERRQWLHRHDRSIGHRAGFRIADWPFVTGPRNPVCTWAVGVGSGISGNCRLDEFPPDRRPGSSGCGTCPVSRERSTGCPRRQFLNS